MGYWANQRVANQLPFDYGNDYYIKMMLFQ